MTMFTRLGLVAPLLTAGLLALATTVFSADAFLPADVSEELIQDDIKLLESAISDTKLKGKGKILKPQGAALIIAAIAQQNLSGKDGPKMAALRDAALKLIKDASESGLSAGAGKALASVKVDPKANTAPTKLVTEEQIEIIMKMFAAEKGGGLALEKDFKALAKKAKFTPADLTKLEKMALKTAIIGHLAIEAAPSDSGGQKTQANWKKWSADMKEAASDIVKAAKAKKDGDIKAGLGKLETSCVNCHNAFR